MNSYELTHSDGSDEDWLAWLIRDVSSGGHFSATGPAGFLM